MSAANYTVGQQGKEEGDIAYVCTCDRANRPEKEQGTVHAARGSLRELQPCVVAARPSAIGSEKHKPAHAGHAVADDVPQAGPGESPVPSFGVVWPVDRKFLVRVALLDYARAALRA